MAALPHAGTAFAATQAAWRFLNNDRARLSALVEPLREAGRCRANRTSAKFALLVHDWCKFTFAQPTRKRDLVQLTHADDVGYELTTALLVSADNGSPLAPMEMHLKTGNGVLSTRSPAPPDMSHLEQVLPTMRASRSWGLNKRLLHVIDREADSVDHLRRWNADGHLFLVRADDRRVQGEGKSHLLSEIRQILRTQGKMQDIGEARHQGHPARLYVAETTVVLDRPAKKNQQGKRVAVPGAPLSLRFVIVQLRDESGQVILAEWMLLTNAPPELVTTEQLAHCYYWRWRIESFFKLLKSHGHQLEQWQQQTGPAIARRLLIAAMACVVVWELQADQSPQANELKTILVRLSGRQMKYGRPSTAPALLAGLWALLSMLALLEHYDIDDLKRLAASIPYRDTA
ncbi:MAG: transposase [Planctomycetaceae bacterium]